MEALEEIPYPPPQSPLADEDIPTVSPQFSLPKNADGSEMTEEQKKAWVEAMTPKMEAIMEDIQANLNAPELQARLMLRGTKVFASQIHPNDIARDWDLIMLPLIEQYVDDHQIQPTKEQIAEFDKANPIDELYSNIEALKINEANLQNYLTDNSLTLEEMQRVSEKLNLAQQAIEELNSLAKAIEEQPEIFLQARYVYAVDSITTAAAFKKIGQTYGGDVVETPHGKLSPDALIQFLVENERKNYITFYDQSYRLNFINYLKSLGHE